MQAEEAYERFFQRVKKNYIEDKVKDGIFGAMMDVQLINDVRMTRQCNFVDLRENSRLQAAVCAPNINSFAVADLTESESDQTDILCRKVDDIRMNYI